MIGPEKPPLCAILCSESTPQKRRGSEGPFGIDSMKAAENCGDIQTLPTRQARIDRKVYPSFFLSLDYELYRQSGFVLCTRLLGKGPAAARRAPGTPGCASASGVPQRAVLLLR